MVYRTKFLGTNWGMQGDFTLPYAYLMDSTLANDFWTIRMLE
jgi:C1A family cysteine protease